MQSKRRRDLFLYKPWLVQRRESNSTILVSWPGIFFHHLQTVLLYPWIHFFYPGRGVYIPPQADVREAQRQLADQILWVERRRENTHTPVIVIGDFNKGNLSNQLPKYKQLIRCPTRGENTLGHCCSTISRAYHAVSRAALGVSDHALIHLIPAYVKITLFVSLLLLYLYHYYYFICIISITD